jgi:hypothetical protein
MFTQEQTNKMLAFINRLTQNPVFATETPIKIEENIYAFLIQNATALRSTFNSAAFFPGVGWNDVQNLFSEVLTNMVNQNLQPHIKMALEKKTNYQFVNVLLGRQLPPNQFQEQIQMFLGKIMNRIEIRRNLDSVLKIINYDVIDKYMQQIFRIKSYIAFEIRNVEKLKIPEEMIPHYIKIILVISLLSFYRADIDASSTLTQRLAVNEVKFGTTAMQKDFYKKLVGQFAQDLNVFNQEFLLKSVSSHMNFLDDPQIPATSRLAKIFFNLGRHFKPNMKIDKGAETFEKSWFVAQRRNFKFFGFDIKMLDELYRIAAENYW